MISHYRSICICIKNEFEYYNRCPKSSFSSKRTLTRTSNSISVNLSNYAISSSLNASNITSGTLSVSRGGIGIPSLTAGQLLIGNGTSASTSLSNLTWDNTSNTSSSTNFIDSGSGIPALNASNIASGTLSDSRGGRGLTANSILIGNGTSALTSSSN
jgi:hypothetical protein